MRSIRLDAKRLLRQTILSCAWLALGPVQAAPTALPDQTRLATLAADPTWIKLLHYEATSSSDTGVLSAVKTESFFLDAKDGPTHPQAELRATLEAILAPPAESPDDQHAQCHFPARTIWLRRKLTDAVTFPNITCPRWQAWAGNHQIDSVSLVLASGFLGNPASYYGHTLLKFNTSPSRRLTALQDPSVSFGVIENGTDDPFTYIVKGIFGGYEGGFSDIAYYFHRNQYGEIELRDLWEYELNLTPDEVLFVAAHAWEVLNRRYQYFFFRRNCAYRMAEIVQVIDDADITPEDRPWTIPQATLQKAATQVRADGRPLLKSVRYAPSRQTRFYASYGALSKDEATVFFDLVERPEALGGPNYLHLSPTSQRAVVDATIDYHQFIADAAQRSSGKLHPVYAAALAERYRLPPAPKSADATPPEPPHIGRQPGWMQAGWLGETREGNSTFIRVRAAYYDPLDSNQGHVPFSGLTMGDIRIKTDGQHIKLDQLDLLVINSANPGVTGLAGDRGQVWQLKAGAEPVKPGCSDCIAARLQGDIGMGRHMGNGMLISVRAGGAIQSQKMDQGPGYVKAAGGLIWRPNAAWGAQLDVETRWPVGIAQSHYNVAKAEWRYALDKSHDLRIRHESSTGTGGGARTLIGVGAYW
jgi:hypothetical protein